MAGCPTGWSYKNQCDTKRGDCTLNACGSGSLKYQKYDHAYHRCTQTVNGITYTDCFWATSTANGCC